MFIAVKYNWTVMMMFFFKYWDLSWHFNTASVAIISSQTSDSNIYLIKATIDLIFLLYSLVLRWPIIFSIFSFCKYSVLISFYNHVLEFIVLIEYNFLLMIKIFNKNNIILILILKKLTNVWQVFFFDEHNKKSYDIYTHDRVE